MDAKAPKRKNADRFSDADVLNANGRPVPADMTNPRSVAILEFLRSNRYGTFSDVYGKVGGDHTSFRRLFRVLKGRTNRYIRITSQSRDDGNFRKSLIYELAPRGIEFLRERGEAIPDRPLVSNFQHAALASHATASIDIGISAQENASLISWEEIKNSKRLPASTGNAKSPFDIPYPAVDKVTGEVRFRHVRADSPVFGIKLTQPDRNLFRFFPGIEADNGTKTERQLIDQFTAYLIIERHRIYESYFGFPEKSWRVPFIVRNAHQADRVQWMMDILRNVSQGQGSRTIMFMRYEPDGKPGYLFTAPWRRVGYSSVILAK